MLAPPPWNWPSQNKGPTYNAATGIVANCPGRIWTTVAAILPEGFTRISPIKSEKSISWSQGI